MASREHINIPSKEKAIQKFNWWIGQAEEYVTNASLESNDPAHVLLHLRLSTEFTLKAVTSSLMNEISKTHHTYKLFGCASLIIPEIKIIFPNDTVDETRLFSLLMPRRIDERMVKSTITNTQEMIELSGRIKALQSLLKNTFSEIIEKVGE
ncbi:MAG: hypothetical protein JWN76_1852 [Chitinophagaceae bacterium]|nr:hypothetical protein [Chitinophagaceae bacterium]